uniref:Uncharacterized protein n=1 Tax=Caenorhabditis japonica TaxID=281687 RepID=A0A8R1ICP9_CAEJA
MVQPQIRSARIRSGTNPHCARIRNRPNSKWYECEAPKLETPELEVVRIRS